MRSSLEFFHKIYNFLSDESRKIGNLIRRVIRSPNLRADPQLLAIAKKYPVYLNNEFLGTKQLLFLRRCTTSIMTENAGMNGRQLRRNAISFLSTHSSTTRENQATTVEVSRKFEPRAEPYE